MFVLAYTEYESIGRNLGHKMDCRWMVELQKYSPTMPSGSWTGSRVGSMMFFTIATSQIHFENTNNILASCFSSSASKLMALLSQHRYQ